MDELKDLLNVEVIEKKDNREVVALVYEQYGYDGGQAFYHRQNALINHLLDNDVDIEKIRIIPMENERLLSPYLDTDTKVFKMIYYGDDISLGLFKKLDKRFTNLEWYEI